MPRPFDADPEQFQKLFANPEQLQKLHELMERVGPEKAFKALSDPKRSGSITLSVFYYQSLLPEIEHEQAPDSLRADKRAIRKWEELTGDPDIRDIEVIHLEMLRDGMLNAGLSPNTVNSVWREVRAMLQAAYDFGVTTGVPRIGRKKSTILVKPTRPIQREPVTLDEVERLWRACSRATYPETSVPAPKLWRVALLLFYTYGIRTSDLMSLTWDNVQWSHRRILFEAHKTSKLQGLPLTDVVIEHLQSLKSMLPGNPKLVCPGFNRRGAHLQRRKRKDGRFVPRVKEGRRNGPVWKPGVYTTWRHEIQPSAEISPPIKFQNFRQSMLTRYNGIELGLGSWIAGHSVPGVSAQYYDNPTARIREAIESAPVPACFHQES